MVANPLIKEPLINDKQLMKVALLPLSNQLYMTIYMRTSILPTKYSGEYSSSIYIRRKTTHDYNWNPESEEYNLSLNLLQQLNIIVPQHMLLTNSKVANSINITRRCSNLKFKSLQHLPIEIWGLQVTNLISSSLSILIHCC